MSEVAPTITVSSIDDFKATIDRITPFAKRVHIDISDGQFAPVQMVSVDEIYWPKEWVVDVHAMVKNPLDYVGKLIAMKPNLITFHAESDVDIIPIIQSIKRYGIKAGVALLKTTVPSTVSEAIKAADHVLIFSGNLGYYGGTASMMQLEKIRLIKKINPKVEIGWDGGINAGNAFTLAQGGVDVLNVGGAINTAEDPAGVYAKLVEEINKQGAF
jgi:ribulose-phosphate 3-epimerase